MNKQHGVSGVVKVKYGWEELQIRSGSRPPFQSLAEMDELTSDPTVVYKVGYPHEFNSWVGAIGATGEDAAAQLDGLQDFSKLCRLAEMAEHLVVAELKQGIAAIKTLLSAFKTIDSDGNGAIQLFELAGFIRAISPTAVKPAFVASIWSIMDRRQDSVVIFKEFLEGCWKCSEQGTNNLLSLERMTNLDDMAIRQHMFVERGKHIVRPLSAMERWGCSRLAPEMFAISGRGAVRTSSVPSPRSRQKCAGSSAADDDDDGWMAAAALDDDMFVNPLKSTSMTAATFETEDGSAGSVDPPGQSTAGGENGNAGMPTFEMEDSMVEIPSWSSWVRADAACCSL